jgi:hypothetical protein
MGIDVLGVVEFAVGQLVPQLPHTQRQAIYGHLPEPGLDDLEQHPLLRRLQPNRLCRADRLERNHHLQASSCLRRRSNSGAREAQGSSTALRERAMRTYWIRRGSIDTEPP